MTSQPDDNPVGPAIVRVLAGTGTRVDEVDLRQWLAADPARERELHTLHAIWAEAGMLQREWATTALQQRILRVTATRVTPLTSGHARSRPLDSWAAFLVRRPLAWFPVAAAALLITVGVIIWRIGGGHLAGAGAEQPGLTEIATRRGQQATLQLSDGTRITLGVDSRLRYPETFTRGARREVYLEGEAYFEVAHDTARPFQVYAGDAVTRVLGTRFGVRAYPEDRTVRVVVAEGKVGFGPRLKPERGAAAEVVLGGGDLGVLEVGGRPTVEHGVDVSSELAWVDGRLVFTDTPLSEVVLQLSRWYNLHVRLGDPSLASTPYTTSLRGDEPPEQVLRVIADAVGGRLERHGTAYVILRRISNVS